MSKTEEFKETYNIDFQIKTLNLFLKDADTLTIAADNLEPTYYSNDILKNYYTLIKTYYDEFGIPPNADILSQELYKQFEQQEKKITKDKDRILLDNEIAEHTNIWPKLWEELEETEYIRTEVGKFCKHQAYKRALLAASKLFQQHKYEEIDALFDYAQSVDTNGMDLGTDLITDFSNRLDRIHNVFDNMKVVPTGIDKLDELMDRGQGIGGLIPGELGVFVGKTSLGKSKMLCNIGGNCLKIGMHVLYITLEMQQDETHRRSESFLSAIPAMELFTREQQLVQFMENQASLWKDKFRVKYFKSNSTSMKTITNWFKIYKKRLGKPDIVLLDYADLLSNPKNMKDWEGKLFNFGSLLGFAKDENVPVWTVTHLNRGSEGQKEPTLAEMGKSYAKVEAPDCIIIMHQSREEEIRNQIRFTFAKCRHFPKPKRKPTVTYSTTTYNMNLSDDAIRM